VIRDTLTGLASLPERQREALLRTAVEGRSQEEVARELGLTDGAVRQLVHRARTSLRSAASAVTPLPLATWFASSGADAPVAVRVAELASGAGSAGIGALVVKGGTVAVVAAAVATGGTPSLRHAVLGHAGRDAAAAASPRHGTTTLTAGLDVVTGMIVCPTLEATRTEPEFVEHIARTVNTDPDAEWIFLVDRLNTHMSESLVKFVAERCGLPDALGKKTTAASSNRW